MFVIQNQINKSQFVGKNTYTKESYKSCFPEIFLYKASAIAFFDIHCLDDEYKDFAICEITINQPEN